MKRYLVLLFLFTGLHYGSFAQDIHFTTVNPPPDNPRSAFEHMTQDPQGCLWIATLQGLYRYNGKEYKIYQHETNNPDAFAGNELFAVFAKNGLIWVGVGGHGMERLDPSTNKFTQYDLRVRHQYDPDSYFADNLIYEQAKI
jgi:hypothetical protein